MSLKKSLMLQAKNQLHSFHFPRDIAKILQILLFRVLWASLLPHTQNDTSTLQKTFVFICRQNSYFIPHVFLDILQRYANFLFWVLWVCLAGHTQNGKINLYKILLFLCMPKINFIIHFFLEVLHFKESCSSIGCRHFGP